ncbi:MAG: L-threonylcarbamoyladenylate synthase, partial [Chthoniobacterales bacterium]
MKTEIVRGKDAVPRAVRLLRAGQPVALPTETVYGLAADALNPRAVLKVFAVKKRPRFDPLIVHVPGPEWIDEIARVQGSLLFLVERLVKDFWPGPLTLVLPRRRNVPDVVTAGLRSVAIRNSAHKVFSAIITEFGRPVAAPSANRFGRISPTSAADVRDELAGRIPLIVDGGRTEHGIESTVVALRRGEIEILRRGPITDEMLRPFGEIREQTSSATISAPGQLPTHYAPRTKLIVVDDLKNFPPPPEKRIGALCLRPVAGVVDPGLPRPAIAATKAPADFAMMRYLSKR